MIALFDTNIYIDELTGNLPQGQFDQWRSQYIIRLSPVVYHELLRGAKNSDFIYEIGQKTILLPAPTPSLWKESGELIKNHRLSSTLQNDLLIALSARESGAYLITRDNHFKEISSFLSFHLLLT